MYVREPTDVRSYSGNNKDSYLALVRTDNVRASSNVSREQVRSGFN